MISIASGQLRVDLLDPADPADRLRQGTRFCWGGYIWQVHAAQAGSLLAGPEWPSSTPSAYNGQGMPEVFKPESLRHDRAVGETDLIIGVGEVRRVPGSPPQLLRPCEWTVRATNDAAEFTTRQTLGAVDLLLVRRIALEGRSLTSSTSLSNRGAIAVRVVAFAHPFFPLLDGRLSCRLSPGYTIGSNPGFTLNERGLLIFTRPFLLASDNEYHPLTYPHGSAFEAVISHPAVGSVRMSADMTPDRCFVWGNRHTWSIEPYFEPEVPPRLTATWSVAYEFGPPASHR
jgi:hypothetical protein